MIRARPHDWGLKLLLKFLRGLLAGRHGDLSYRCKYSAVFIIVQNLILLVVRIHYRNRTGDVGLSEFTLSVLLTLHLMLEHLLGLLRQVRRMLSIYSHSTKRNLLCLSRLRVVRILLGVMVVVLLEVCPCVVLMIVAGLRCPLVGFLLPLHGVIDLWVLLCKVGWQEVWLCYSTCNEYTAIHFLLQSKFIYKLDSFQLTRNAIFQSTYSNTASDMCTKDVVSMRENWVVSTSWDRLSKLVSKRRASLVKLQSVTFSSTKVALGDSTG